MALLEELFAASDLSLDIKLSEVSFNSNAVWSIVSDAVVKGDLEYWF